jgi:hypothetical protein
VLAEDPELADAVPAERRARGIEECTAPELNIAPGPWPDAEFLGREGIGVLVLAGLLIRRVDIDGRFGAEILGESDVLRPWQLEDAPMLALDSGWTVLAAARLALLDEQFTRRLGAYPEVTVCLFERTIRRARHLLVNMAIIHQARVDERLRMLLWHLAGRWGRVRGDGVLLPFRVTHTVLADLVAARRPTVTTALSELTRRGLIQAHADGWLLIGEPPRELAALGEPSSRHANRA